MKMKAGTLVAVAISVFLLVAGVGVGITAHVSSYSCERKAAKLAVPYKWDLTVGCFIETENGKWVPADSL